MTDYSEKPSSLCEKGFFVLREKLCVDANGELRDVALGFGLIDDGIEVRENFFDGHGVDLATGVVTFLDELLKVAACDLRGKLIGDDFAGALLLLDPGGGGQGDPHGAIVDIKADIDGVGMARGDGDDVGLPAAVQVFARPAVRNMEVFVHDFKGNVEEGGAARERGTKRQGTCRDTERIQMDQLWAFPKGWAR